MVIPDSKKDILDRAQEDVETVIEQYQEGLITDGERYNKGVDIWAEAADKVASDLLEGIGREVVTDPETGEQRQPDESYLYDGRFGRARFQSADTSAGRHARFDG